MKSRYIINRKQTFSIRKFKIGVASALIGASLMATQSIAANDGVTTSNSEPSTEINSANDSGTKTSVSNTENFSTPSDVVPSTVITTTSDSLATVEENTVMGNATSTIDTATLSIDEGASNADANVSNQSSTPTGEPTVVETVVENVETQESTILPNTEAQNADPSNITQKDNTANNGAEAQQEQSNADNPILQNSEPTVNIRESKNVSEQPGDGLDSNDLITLNRNYQSLNESTAIRPITVALPEETSHEIFSEDGKRTVTSLKTSLDFSYFLESNRSAIYNGLPNGLSYDPTEKQVTGTVGLPGQYSILFQATKQEVVQLYSTDGVLFKEDVTALGSDTKLFELDVNALSSTKQATFATTNIQPITVLGGIEASMTAFSYVTTSQGETKVYAGLPDGLHYDQASGQIQGTPSHIGQYQILAQAINGSNNIITEATLIVTEPSQQVTNLFVVPTTGNTIETPSQSLAIVTPTVSGALQDTTATATGKDSVAIGNNSIVTGEQSTAVGYGNIVTGDNAGAFGDPSVINGAATYTVGNDNYVADGSDENQALGNNNQIGGTVNYGTDGAGRDGKLLSVNPVDPADTSLNSSILGSRNYINSSNTYIIGTGVNTIGTGNDIQKLSDSVENSVYLGSDSTVTAGAAAGPGTLFNDLKDSLTDGATTTAGATGTVTDATVNGITYGGFAGETSVGAVSVGASGAERRIQNVAAGEISSTSTDAINGSQLYSVVETVGWNIVADKTAAGTNTGTVENQFISPNETVKLIAGNGVNIEQAGNDFIFSVKYDPSIFKLNENGEITFLNKPSVTVTNNNNGTHTVNIVNVDGTTSTTTIKDGENGKDGKDGVNGKDGISPTAEVTTTDGASTITITNSDGTVTTATVMNGKDGKDGKDGVNGISPTIDLVDNGDGSYTITVTNADGTTTETIVRDGSSPTASVVPNGDGSHTITITNVDGRTTETLVKDGVSPIVTFEDNLDGSVTVKATNADGSVNEVLIYDGKDGADGKDGVSPTASVVDNGDGTYTITTVNADGTSSTVTVKDGKDGIDGINGKDGASATASVVDNGDGSYTISITDANGTSSSVTVKDGIDGKDGASATASVVDNEDGTYTITITNPDGTTSSVTVKD
ncbi:YSIRK-type signal peptide-containing protein, partial [Streptococcus suis]|nr:YSIRK-type signal peptide-containing protein [Streptococcus suis]